MLSTCCTTPPFNPQVKLLTPNAPGITCGPNVTINMEPETPMYDVKLQLQVGFLY